MKNRILMVCALTLTAALCRAQNEVPDRYKAMYEQYVSGLKRYNAFLDKSADQGGKSVCFGAELLAANSNRGEVLLEPRTLKSMEISLDRFREMGIGGATVAIGYPILTDDAPHAKEYLDFYKSVAGMVRERKMKLCVKLHVLFAGTDFSPVKTDFSKLTVDRLAEQKRLMAERVISAMRPEYLTLGGEPDTEAKLTGNKKLNEPGYYAGMVRSILRGLNRATTLVGVGQGTWSSPEFAKAYAKTDVDFINIHIYPFGKRVIKVLNEIIAVARENDKRLLIDECWLYKLSGGEAGSVEGAANIYRRDIYSFWQPADELFLQAMAKLASQNSIEYVSPFWSHCFFGYRTYDSSDEKLSYRDLNAIYLPLVSQNMISGKLSKTGTFYSELIRKYGSGADSSK